MDSSIRKVLDKHKKLTEFDVKVLMYNLSKGCGPLTEEEAEKNKEKEK